MRKIRWNCGVLALVALCAAAYSTAQAEEVSNRMDNRLGAYLSILGDPDPTLVGINGAYNITDFLRASVGFGRVSTSLGTESASLTTIGAGVKGFMPGWSLSPTVGFGLAYAIFSGDSLVSVNNLSSNTLNPYLSFGVDWQAKSGFNVGVAMNVSLNGAENHPCINIGWFF